VAGRRASGPPPGALAAPGNRCLTSRPGSEATRAACWPERPVHRARTGQKYR